MSQRRESECILVVDDSADTREVLQRNLEGEGYRALCSPDVAGAVEVLESTHVDLVITDLKMPKCSGLDLIQHVRENFRDSEVMMITGYPSIEGAVKAVKTGAEEYLAKPFTDEELISAVRRVLDKLKIRRSSRYAERLVLPLPHGLIGESKAMRGVYSTIEKASTTSATVRIAGESGTGKELVARAVHYGSSRSSAPFVPVNCGAIPGELLESELFGHMKGAFTGAAESRAGFFHAADGGSIFLDEISEASLSMQVKLLRVLEDKQVCMVGSSKPQKVDVRILAASNRDLRGLVEKGGFREDLFYRLDVIVVDVPPLRERGNDTMLLCHHFAARFAGELGKPTPRFSDNALQVIRDYYWPGNVRELENVIQRLVVMTEGELIDAPDLPSLMRFSALRGTGLHRSLAEVETEHIRNVLASVGGNKTKAAEILGIDRKTLRVKLKA